jgi:dCTP deaminase
MSNLSDHRIKNFVATHNMIDPFIPQQVREWDGRKIVSYGLSSAGYDIRMAPVAEYPLGELDPLNPNGCEWGKLTLEKRWGFDCFKLLPGVGILTHSIEYFRMPRNIRGDVTGKSTYARKFLVSLMTPLEPEWEGQLVLEVANVCNQTIYIYPNMGVAQVLFVDVGEVQVSYKDRDGKYQGQTGVTKGKA